MTTLPTIEGATRALSPVEKRSELAWIRRELEACKRDAGMEGVTFEVQWNGRFTRRLGDSLVQTKRDGSKVGRLRFSSTALYLRATAEERRNLVRHEAAHSLADIRHGKRCKHGPLWKAMMRELGVSPDRCHAVNRDGLHRKGSRGALIAKLRQTRPNLVRKALGETPKPRPVVRVERPTVEQPRTDLVGKLVAWQTDHGQAVGRVVETTGSLATILVVGDHLRHLHGRHATVEAAACRLY